MNNVNDKVDSKNENVIEVYDYFSRETKEKNRSKDSIGRTTNFLLVEGLNSNKPVKISNKILI